MDKTSNEPKSAPAKPDQFKAEREQRGDATTPAPADQRGATEGKVTPLTPPTSEKPAKPAPGGSSKQRAADEIDPADELTPG